MSDDDRSGDNAKKKKEKKEEERRIKKKKAEERRRKKKKREERRRKKKEEEIRKKKKDEEKRRKKKKEKEKEERERKSCKLHLQLISSSGLSLSEVGRGIEHINVLHPYSKKTRKKCWLLPSRVERTKVSFEEVLIDPVSISSKIQQSNNISRRRRNSFNGRWNAACQRAMSATKKRLVLATA